MDGLLESGQRVPIFTVAVLLVMAWVVGFIAGRATGPRTKPDCVLGNLPWPGFREYRIRHGADADGLGIPKHFMAKTMHRQFMVVSMIDGRPQLRCLNSDYWLIAPYDETQQAEGIRWQLSPQMFRRLCEEDRVWPS